MEKRPLPNSFLLFAIFGLIVSGVLWEDSRIDATWGAAMIIFFAICLIASLVSIAPPHTPKPYAPKPVRQKQKRRK